MIPCPSCHQPVEILEKHMGTLFTCPHCSAVYFVDWNGQPELAQHESEPASVDGGGGGFEPPISEYAPAYEQVPVYEEAPISEEIPASEGAFEDLAFQYEVPSESPTDTPDFSDVTDFANDNTSIGPLSYTLTIEGADSSLLLAQLKEAMTDSRFGWDVESILSNVGSGHIVLRGLTPAKASVLINRIKYLPFKIFWRQDVLSSS